MAPIKGQSIEDLVLADRDAVLAYARCQKKHGNVVNAYNLMTDAFKKLRTAAEEINK